MKRFDLKSLFVAVPLLTLGLTACFDHFPPPLTQEEVLHLATDVEVTVGEKALTLPRVAARFNQAV